MWCGVLFNWSEISRVQIACFVQSELNYTMISVRFFMIASSLVVGAYDFRSHSIHIIRSCFKTTWLSQYQHMHLGGNGYNPLISNHNKYKHWIYYWWCILLFTRLTIQASQNGPVPQIQHKCIKIIMDADFVHKLQHRKSFCDTDSGRLRANVRPV